jgi:hypothetical protein
MGKIALEEHVILDRQEHLDRWRTLVPFIPEQTRQQLIARLTDTSARGPRLVRRDRRDHRDEAPPSPPRSPRSSHSSPRRRPATSAARPSPPTAAAPPSEAAFSKGRSRSPPVTTPDGHDRTAAQIIPAAGARPASSWPARQAQRTSYESRKAGGSRGPFPSGDHPDAPPSRTGRFRCRSSDVTP